MAKKLKKFQKGKSGNVIRCKRKGIFFLKKKVAEMKRRSVKKNEKYEKTMSEDKMCKKKKSHENLLFYFQEIFQISINI